MPFGEERRGFEVVGEEDATKSSLSIKEIRTKEEKHLAIPWDNRQGILRVKLCP